jgi:exosortase
MLNADYNLIGVIAGQMFDPLEEKPQTGRNRLFLVMVAVSIIVYWHWLVALLRLAYSTERYTHVLLVLPVSIWLAVRQGLKGFRCTFASRPAMVLLLPAFVLRWAVHTKPPMSDSGLALGIGSLVACWIGLVIWIYGVDAFSQLRFPLLFLLLMIPIPPVVVDKCILALQVASLETTRQLFRLAGVPVLKNGFVLSLPEMDIEVAKQCSGIRSTLMLLLAALVLSHIYLRQLWTKVLFVVAAVPVSIAKNAVRIFTLSMLGVRVDPSFLYGNLHRNGGVVFFILALTCMMILLTVLRRAEGQKGPLQSVRTS